MILRNIYTLLILISVQLYSCANKEVEPGTVLEGELHIGLINDQFRSQDISVYGNSQLAIMQAVSNQLTDSSKVILKESSLAFPDVFEGDDGTIWNIWGEYISGPTHLDITPIASQMGYFFGFSTFFPITTLVGENEQESVGINHDDGGWLIDPGAVFKGAVRDGIPPIEHPLFVKTSESGSAGMNDTELVTVVKIKNGIKVYPHKILNWHEVVNDLVDQIPAVISLCPLTGTSDAWATSIIAEKTTMGVSGLLYNNNLLLYDRATNSYWSQILRKAVSGELMGQEVETFQSLEMTWAAAKLLTENILLLTETTGYSRDYSVYPYGSYLFSEHLLYPITYVDDRVFNKERVLHLQVNGKSKIYRFSNLD